MFGKSDRPFWFLHGKFAFDNRRIFLRAGDSKLSFEEFLRQCAEFQGESSGSSLFYMEAHREPRTLMRAVAAWQRGETVLPLHPGLPEGRAREIIAELKSQAPAGPIPRSLRKRPATLLLTSGSSGRPKVVLHDFEAHWRSYLGFRKVTGFGPEDRWLLSLPLYHAGGLAIFFRCAFAGAQLLVPETGTSLSAQIITMKPTCLSLVPTQLHTLLEEKSCLDELRKCRLILLGGAPIPVSLLEAASAAGVKTVRSSYGMTETASLVTLTDASSPAGSAGRVLPGRKLRIRKGEIQLSGKTLFSGYFPERRSRGWFASGDRGEIRKGELFVIGRFDRMFISGGENIQPETVEQALVNIPGVQKVRVTAVQDEHWGAVGVAFVQMENFDAEALRKQCRLILPAHEIPKKFLSWPEFPSMEMKIQAADWVRELEKQGLKPEKSGM